MNTKWDHIWNRLGFGTPGKKARLAKKPTSHRPRPKSNTAHRNELKQLALARKYFDDYNRSTSSRHKLVLGFTHENEMARPYHALCNPILREKMRTGVVLHYTAAGILAYELDKKLHKSYNVCRSAMPDAQLDNLEYTEEAWINNK